MRILGSFMRIFGFAFHFLLGLVMMAIGFVAWASNQHTLRIGFLPWNGPTLTSVLFWCGLAAIVFTLLAVWRKLRYLFLLWAIAVPVLLIRGVFFTGFSFGQRATTASAALADVADSTPVVLLVASLAALVGGVLQMRRRRQHVWHQTAIV